MRTRFTIAVLVLLPALIAAAGAEKFNFLNEKSTDLVALLPSPPSRDSDEARGELDMLVALQVKRTPAQEERCRSEEKLTMAAFESVFGEWFTAENLPKVDELLRKASKDAGVFLDTAKTHFERPRPYAVDARVRPCVEKENSYSYPSGHATRGILFARILVKLAPGLRAEIFERGREIGWNRVIAGVHRPSDITAGRTCGEAIADALMENREFQQELAAAKVEFEEAKHEQSDPVLSGAK